MFLITLLARASMQGRRARRSGQGGRRAERQEGWKAGGLESRRAGKQEGRGQGRKAQRQERTTHYAKIVILAC